MALKRKIFVLTVGGTDPTAGAGVFLDIRLISSQGIYPLAVVSAVTVQDIFGVKNSFPVPPDVFSRQLEAVLKFFPVKWVKVSVLPEKSHAQEILKLKKKFRFHIVFDPVFLSKNQFKLSDESALQILARESEVITPNRKELEVITQKSVKDIKEALKVSFELSENGRRTVILKGGHFEVSDIHTGSKDFICDWFVSGSEAVCFRKKRVREQIHGTGCALASLICCNLAKGIDAKRSFFLAERKLGYLLSKTLKTEGFRLFDV